MAKRIDWNNKPAYEEGPMILQQNDEGKWLVYHAKTTMKIMGDGIDTGFKQKRDALAYAQNLIESFDTNFSNKEEMYAANGGRDNCVRLRNEAYFKAIDDKQGK